MTGPNLTVETLFSRYRTNGAQDPRRQHPDWNRYRRAEPDAEPRGGVLLLHGLTDSPYSLRRIGELFVAKGYYVVALRLPGHGTMPGALVERELARLGRREPGRRACTFTHASVANGLFVIARLLQRRRTCSDVRARRVDRFDVCRKPDALVLLSPEIGITPIAVISNAGRRLTYLPYFEQFKWLSIEPEYDPYKYNSFPKNASENAWQVTQAVERGMEDARQSGRSAQFPRVLTFLSWTDSTVETASTIGDFYDHLENPNSELVIFDVNRFDTFKGFMPPNEDAQLDALQARADLPYRLTVVGNAVGRLAVGCRAFEGSARQRCDCVGARTRVAAERVLAVARRDSVCAGRPDLWGALAGRVAGLSRVCRSATSSRAARRTC